MSVVGLALETGNFNDYTEKSLARIRAIGLRQFSNLSKPMMSWCKLQFSLDEENPINRAYMVTDEVRKRDESLNHSSGVSVFTGVATGLEGIHFAQQASDAF